MSPPELVQNELELVVRRRICRRTSVQTVKSSLHRWVQQKELLGEEIQLILDHTATR